MNLKKAARRRLGVPDDEEERPATAADRVKAKVKKPKKAEWKVGPPRRY